MTIILMVAASVAVMIAIAWCVLSKMWEREAGECLTLAREACDQRDTWRSIATDLEDKLRQIETKRHNSAKHARGVQLAKAKALRDTKTTELRRDLEASLAEPERQAA